MGLLIKINTDSSRPLFRQIMEQITELIDSGALEPGVRLPSSRELAKRLGVNRSTVYKSYQELWALGYLNSRPGSYSTIRHRTQVASQKDSRSRGLIDWDRASVRGSRDLYEKHFQEASFIETMSGRESIDFHTLAPDSRLFPIDEFRKCMNYVLVNEGSDVLQYGSPQGYRPLREFIAQRMRQHSVSVSADEILITTGAQNGIELLLQLLTEPGSGVVFEAPTYSRAMDIFRLRNVKTIEIPMKEDGMDLAALEQAIVREIPALIYTIPNFHNPTGITTDQGHREGLLRICTKHRVPLVEDGFEEEMKYFGKAVLPIKSMDHSGVVIYLGTFSKVLFPGLRIGWIAAEKACVERLISIQKASILSGNTLDQAAVDRFCRQGYYDLHIKRMHRIYRKRMQTALKAMKEHLPAELVTWTQPAGGYTIWVQMQGRETNEDTLVSHLIDHGLKILPGRFHYFGPSTGVQFRLSIAHLEESEIKEGLKRLGAALKSY